VAKAIPPSSGGEVGSTDSSAAGPSATTPEAESPGGSAPGLRIDNHRALLGMRRQMLSALTRDPGASRMLFANPVLAFRDVGVTITPTIADHIRHVVSHPPRVRTERERLTEKLKEALGTDPHPSKPVWLASIVFDQLGVPPLETAGHEPVYVPALGAGAEERLRALLPPPTRRRIPGVVVPPRPVPGVWRLDLDAAGPELQVSTDPPPGKLSLDELWFYRGRHDLVDDLLRLGIIEKSALPVLGPATYRKVKDGALTNGLIDWVDSVRFPRSARQRRS
jgi:hypothetical protein